MLSGPDGAADGDDPTVQGASDAKNALDAAINWTNGTTKPARKAYKRKAPVTSQSAEAQGDDATLRATKKRLL